MLRELLNEISQASEAFLTNAKLQCESGNKAAGSRARKNSKELERLAKAFRKASLESAKTQVSKCKTI